MSDELPTAARVSDPGIRALYAQENRWQAWLDVEAALAARRRKSSASSPRVRPRRSRGRRISSSSTARASTRASRAPATPSCRLVWELGRVTGEPYGGWVHWGATTQNITQTGDLLVLRQAHRVFLGLIGEALKAMADLAERGAEMPIAGRTHGQHAVPATFGYKPAVWIDELIRHVERFHQAAPRIFVAMLGGGAGTFASLGEQGPAVQAGIGKQLGMLPMQVPSRTIGDHLAENICLLGLLAGDLRQDRPRDLHPDEDRVRRGRGAGAAGHGRQLDDAAKAQPQAVPGHHRRRGRGALLRAVGAWRRCRPSTRPTAPPA